MQQDVIIPCLNRSLCLFLLLRCWVLRWTPSTLYNSQITQVSWAHWEPTVVISIVEFYRQGRPWPPFPPHVNTQKPRQNSQQRMIATIVFPEVTVAPWMIYNDEWWWKYDKWWFNSSLGRLTSAQCSWTLTGLHKIYNMWLSRVDSGIFRCSYVSCECWPPNRKDKLHVKTVEGRTQ